MRHAPNASDACTGGYNCLQGDCSRIIPTTTRGEQPSTSIGRGWHRLSRTDTTSYRLTCRDSGSMRGIRHAPYALTVCMRGYSCLQADCSRIAPTTTCGKQPSTSIRRCWQHLPRAHASSNCLSVWDDGSVRGMRHAPNASDACTGGYSY